MTQHLNFGVTDIPYADAEGMTTGDVAEILEARYHVMQMFYETYKDRIDELLADSLGGDLETMLMGGKPSNNPLLSATSEIENMFRMFLSTQEFEQKTYGDLFFPVPTKAALKGVNHRLKHPYAKSNPRRPSLIDTGTYENSFIAWMTEDES